MGETPGITMRSQRGSWTVALVALPFGSTRLLVGRCPPSGRRTTKLGSPVSEMVSLMLRQPPRQVELFARARLSCVHDLEVQRVERVDRSVGLRSRFAQLVASDTPHPGSIAGLDLDPR